MSKTTSHFALSPQGVPSRTKKQRPDPNRDFRAESHYGSAFLLLQIVISLLNYMFLAIFLEDRNYIEKHYHYAAPLN